MVKISEQTAVVVDEIAIDKWSNRLSTDDLIHYKYRTVFIARFQDKEKVKRHSRDLISSDNHIALERLISAADIRITYDQSTQCTAIDLSKYQPVRC